MTCFATGRSKKKCFRAVAVAGASAVMWCINMIDADVSWGAANISSLTRTWRGRGEPDTWNEGPSAPKKKKKKSVT